MKSLKHSVPAQVSGAAAVTTVIATIFATRGLSIELQLAIVSVFTMIAVSVPWAWQNICDRREMRLVEIQFIDFMCSFRMYVMSGLSMSQAIQESIEGKNGILAGELYLCLDRARRGQSFEDSLNEFKATLALPAVQEFVVTIHVLKEVGGNLAEPVDTLARNYRMGLVEQSKQLYARQRFALQLAILILAPPLAWQGVGFANFSPAHLILVAGCALLTAILVAGRNPSRLRYRGTAHDWHYPGAAPSRPLDSETAFARIPAHLRFGPPPVPAEPLQLDQSASATTSVAEMSQFRGSQLLRGEDLSEETAEVSLAMAEDVGPMAVEPIWRTEFVAASETPVAELVVDEDTKKIWWLLQETANLRKGILVVIAEGVDGKKAFQKLMKVIPAEDRVALIEDSKQLALVHETGIHLVGRPATEFGEQAVFIHQLIPAAIQMGARWVLLPDAGAMDSTAMLQYIGTRTTSSMMCVQARGAREGLRVFERRQNEDHEFLRGTLSACFSMIVHVGKLEDGTVRLLSATELTGLHGSDYLLTPIFAFTPEGYDQHGKPAGRTLSTGLLPKDMERYTDTRASRGYFSMG